MASADINITVLSGRLTRDIEVKATGSGTPIGNLGLAYNGLKKEGGEWIEVPNFIDLVIIGSRAESLARYLTKGTKVCVTGELRHRTWESNGQKRSKHELRVDKIQFMGPGKRQDGGDTDPAETYDEDCPF